MIRPLLSALLLLVGLARLGAAAESRAVALERAIYKEETAGDVDAAIVLYREIVADSDVDRAVTAQALYRLGSCLERRGRTDEARATFNRLVKEFPEQKELVAKVRGGGQTRLEPVPWSDREALRYQLRSAADDRLMSAEEIEIYVHSGSAWTILRYMLNASTFVMPGDLRASSIRVEVEAETFSPLSSLRLGLYTSPTDVRYAPGKATVTTKGVTSAVELREAVFDQSQLPSLLRRLPLAEGYAVTLPVFSSTAGVTEAQIAVLGRETVTVPAGTFDCFKVSVSVGPVFTSPELHWISADTHRYPVKQGQATLRLLARVETWDLQAAQPFEDASWGVSLAPPAGWLVTRSAPAPDERRFGVSATSPDVEVGCTLVFENEAGLLPRRDQTPRELAEERLKTYSASRPVAVRAESWSDAPAAGLPTVRYVADYHDPRAERDSVLYTMVIRSQATVATVACVAPSPIFERHRGAMDALAASLRLP